MPAGPGGALPAALSAIYRPLPPARGLAGSPRPLQGGSGRPELRKTPGEPRAAAPGARLRAPQRSGGANTEGCRHRECKQQLPPARLPLALRARRSPHARKGRRGHGSPAGSGRRPPAALTVPPPPPRAPPPPCCCGGEEAAAAAGAQRAGPRQAAEPRGPAPSHARLCPAVSEALGTSQGSVRGLGGGLGPGGGGGGRAGGWGLRPGPARPPASASASCSFLLFLLFFLFFLGGLGVVDPARPRRVGLTRLRPPPPRPCRRGCLPASFPLHLPRCPPRPRPCVVSPAASLSVPGAEILVFLPPPAVAGRGAALGARLWGVGALTVPLPPSSQQLCSVGGSRADVALLW